MRPALLLLGHSLKRVRILVISTGVLLGAFQVVLILVGRSVQRNGGFEQLTSLLPPFFREMLGPALTSFMSFSGIVSLGYFHLAVMSALVAIAIVLSTSPAAEIETGFIDLILSRPLARYWIVTRSIAAVLLCAAFLLGTMLTGTFAGLNALAPRDAVWPSAQHILTLALNLGMLMLCWSGVAMAIASNARRRSVAGGMAGLLALLMFFLDYTGRLWKPADKIAWLSPFRYFNPFDIMMGKPFPVRNLAVLAIVALAGFSIAYVLYTRRDIAH